MPEVLTAETGREPGSRASNRLRRTGKVPGVLYGLGMEPVRLAVEWSDLRRTLVAGGLSSPIRLRVEGHEHLTIVREMQRHPVRRDVTHIDFLAVDPDQPVSIEVPVVLVGLEPGDDAADLAIASHVLTVTAKPAAIPAEITVDAARTRQLGIFRVEDLDLPAGVITDVDPETVLVQSGADVEIVDETLEAPEAEAGDGTLPAECGDVAGSGGASDAGGSEASE
jgi:large subunit ribosomal protein L25